MSLNFKRRLIGLQERMINIGLDLVVYGSCQNFQYLTGLLLEWRRGMDLGSARDAVKSNLSQRSYQLFNRPARDRLEAWSTSSARGAQQEKKNGLLKRG